ncbi:bifunctional phosphopantothenoylcysteine decarboxylase/phosphopantothenate--cysteine ligase CoaBC [Motilimonas sp. 1_MG-2023]|uniref:bifunctional phosphopantothenoylcysteine decarboxylase/phosphopantothenate--cysteine ligase CoaBC n=1 Tax=Motilimonas sp. 1_MG-2023 TaxID=3062672 RepID=UPI0026E3BD12|nr:bifunctional phosphopantothenoylcysteine decarboxylase/phosphopantothenate--cysteine ligase CoaBC [Motilimonas sp. 1_MG-2023]MDO6526852.1 bifunctional phosphopantothenoylcysteine decarboxylase/phosphopantothenate--cysteine ligase CoaBC [Motilimonas sp. 1_MG-2023]
MNLHNKNILLGICGGIAAYKCAELTRRLKDHGANVRVVMTQSAKAFITPLTMQAVSGNPVSDSLLDPAAEAGMGHIELAKWADLILVAPASANTIARLTAGIADDLLSTLCLATPAPIAIAPAMNQQMYLAPATQANLTTLKQRGTLIWGPAQGQQACGDVGPGRMLEPDELVQHCQQQLNPNQDYAGIRVLITAGPTREPIDPVRYLSNHSSGKMGYALAQAAQQAGATVTLVSGPVNLTPPAGVAVVNVMSALEMHRAATSRSAQHDIFIGCAAVADYRPESVADNKIKKSNDELVVKMVKNPDILADIANSEPRPFCVGFAAETQDVEHYAKDKLTRKKLDLIAANDVAKAGQGFNTEQNSLTVFSKTDAIHIPLASKLDVANALLSLVLIHYKK